MINNSYNSLRNKSRAISLTLLLVAPIVTYHPDAAAQGTSTQGIVVELPGPNGPVKMTLPAGTAFHYNSQTGEFTVGPGTTPSPSTTPTPNPNPNASPDPTPRQEATGAPTPRPTTGAPAPKPKSLYDQIRDKLGRWVKKGVQIGAILDALSALLH